MNFIGKQTKHRDCKKSSLFEIVFFADALAALHAWPIFSKMIFLISHWFQTNIQLQIARCYFPLKSWFGHNYFSTCKQNTHAMASNGIWWSFWHTENAPHYYKGFIFQNEGLPSPSWPNTSTMTWIAINERIGP